MLAEATQEVRMLFSRLNSEVVNLPHVAGIRDKSSQLGERDSSSVTAILDRCHERVVVYGVRTERDLG
jgi:hypothetical protein